MVSFAGLTFDFLAIANLQIPISLCNGLGELEPEVRKIGNEQGQQRLAQLDRGQRSLTPNPLRWQRQQIALPIARVLEALSV